MSPVAREAFVARRFDDLAGRFRDDVGVDDVRLSAVIDGLALSSGMRVLDVGCGKGRFARRLFAMGADVVGVDASAGMLGECVGIPAMQASATRLPFENGAFDGVFSIEVFEHLDRTSVDLAIDEMARVVRPGGRVVIVDKNRKALDAKRPWLPAIVVKWIDERRGRWMYGPGDPVRERWFSASSMARRLARRLDAVQWSYLLRPEEAGRAVFRVHPSSRLFIAWRGIVR